MLYKANIFGGINKKISGIIAFVISFFVAAYSGPVIAKFMATLFSGSSILIAGILSIILFAVLLGYTKEDWTKKKHALWGVIAIGAIIFILAAGGDFLNLRLFVGGTSALTGLIIVAFLIAIVFFITSGGEEIEEGKKEEKKKTE